MQKFKIDLPQQWARIYKMYWNERNTTIPSKENKKMIKKIYIDIETGGLNPKEHAITSIACIICTHDKVTEKALKVQGKTIDELIEDGITQQEAFFKLLNFFEDNNINKENKAQPVGYNVQFDLDFLEELFTLYDYNLYDFLSHRSIDILNTVRQLESWELINTENNKLKTVCEYFNIPLIAHNALNDIRATKQLEQKLKDTYLTNTLFYEVQTFIKDNPIELIKTHMQDNNYGSARVALHLLQQKLNRLGEVFYITSSWIKDKK